MLKLTFSFILFPVFAFAQAVQKPCVEEKITLLQEFVPTSFEERSTVGKDQIEPLRLKISEFLKSDPKLVPTDVMVVSSSAKLPFQVLVSGKRVSDPQSNSRNLSLAQDRARFTAQVLGEIQKSNSSYSKISFFSKSELSGPDFVEKDLNQRFVTKMTENYPAMVKELYKENKALYEKEALVKSPEELMDEQKFPNLYQAKYKPFQGFRLTISGYHKDKLKCSDKASEASPTKAKASKQ